MVDSLSLCVNGYSSLNNNQMTSKDFYRNYEADLVMNPLNLKLIELVIESRTNTELTAFEFGCGMGKHLKYLSDYMIAVAGIDISQKNIDVCRSFNLLTYQGDETFLSECEGWSIVFTCSVLCHIENIDEIILEFKRIATHKIFLAETQDTPEGFHYFHDYESYGFKKVTDGIYSPGNHLTYYIWEWTKQ